MLETVRTPKAVPINPDKAALKAMLVRERMLVATNTRILAVKISRFVQVIISGISTEVTIYADGRIYY